MAEADFLFLTGGLDAPTVARGVSSGFTPPTGGGAFVFGFHSLIAASGVVGLYAAQANFNPLLDDSAAPSGGSVRGAMKRAASAGPIGFAPFLLIGLQGSSVNDQGYLLGLSDNDPHEVVLVKGAPIGGLDPTGSGVLRRGSETFVPDTWHHLRLDMIVNPNGDVILKCFKNVGSVLAPSWVAIPGMADFVDDALSVNSGSAPFIGGHVGYAFEVTESANRRAFFDQIECHRQR
jgi:hypothetical protein